LWFINFPTAGTRFSVRGRRSFTQDLKAMVERHSPALAGEVAVAIDDPRLDGLDWCELLGEIEGVLAELSE
jgi:hypothetical protein